MHTQPPLGNRGPLLYTRTRFSVMGPGAATRALNPSLAPGVWARAGWAGVGGGQDQGWSLHHRRAEEAGGGTPVTVHSPMTKKRKNIPRIGEGEGCTGCLLGSDAPERRPHADSRRRCTPRGGCVADSRWVAPSASTLSFLWRLRSRGSGLVIAEYFYISP